MKTLAQIEPRTPIASLPFTIASPGGYYVTTNLTGVAASQGIIIQSDDVTLDLNGFTLTGVAGALSGITLGANAVNVEIRNGTLSHWALGVDARAANHCRFEGLRVSLNGAIGLATGIASFIQSCTAISNQGIGISTDQGSTINDSRAWGSQQHGFSIGSGSQLKNCTASFNMGNGFVLSDNCLMADCALPIRRSSDLNTPCG